jgi:hypothetical protein
LKREGTTMSTEARQVEDARGPSPTPEDPLPQRGLLRALASLMMGIVVGGLAPLAMAAPKTFANRAQRHPLVTPVTVIALLVPAWLHAMSLTFGIEHNSLILGVFGLVGLWAVATILGIELVSRWDESDKTTSIKAASLVFSFGGGFCLLLLVYYYLAVPAVRNILEPRLPSRMGTWVTVDVVMMGIRLMGLVLAPIAPIQIFRGLASVGGGAVPTLEPLCRDCGYSLEGVQEAYRDERPELAARDMAAPVCSECGLELATSLEESARDGTPWTRSEDLSGSAWRRTLREVIRQPRAFFEHLPLGASREAAVRFWERNLLAALAGVAILFGANLGLCALTGMAPPIPISGYDPSPSTVNIPTAFWLPATITGMALVMWAVVMSGTIVLCATAEYVWKRATMLRGRNMHPAGLLTACYLSGHVFAIEAAATAAFLGMRLAVLAIPTNPPPIPFDAMMLLRRHAANIGMGAGLAVAGLGWLLLYWPAAMKGGLAMRHANR